MPPVLVAEEIVLDEGSRERFGKRPPDISVIYFGCEDRDMRGA